MGLGAGADVPHHGDGGLARRLECLGRKGQVELAAEPGKQPFRRHSEALPITGGLLRTVVAPARMLGAFMRQSRVPAAVALNRCLRAARSRSPRVLAMDSYIAFRPRYVLTPYTTLRYAM